MRALTANVFITKSLPAIEQMHFSKHKIKTFSQRIKTLSQSDLEQSFIASPLKNDGLMYFEYGFAKNSDKGKTYVTMRLLETSKFLEMFLLENDPLTRMLSKLDDTRDKHRGTELLGGKKYQLDSEGTPVSYKVVPPKVIDSISQNPLKKIKHSSRYYFSFGSSDNIDEWTGPIAMQLASVQLRNEENNERVIEVTFVPDLDTFRSWSRKFEETVGYKSNLTSLSQYQVPNSAQISLAKEVIPNPLGRVFNLDYRIRNLIKNYIGSFTEMPGNAVVVLPDDMGSFEVLGKSQPATGPQPLQQKSSKRNGITLSNTIVKSNYFTSDSRFYNELIREADEETVSVGSIMGLNDFGINVALVRDLTGQYNKTLKAQEDYLKSKAVTPSQVQTPVSTDPKLEKDFKKLLRSELAAYQEKVGLESDALFAQNDKVYEEALESALQRRNELITRADTTAPGLLTQIGIPGLNNSVPPAERQAFAINYANERYDKELEQAAFRRDNRNLEIATIEANKLDPNKREYREAKKEAEDKVARIISEDQQATKGSRAKGPRQFNTTNPSLIGYEGSISEVGAQSEVNNTLSKYNILNESTNVEGNWDLITDTVHQLAKEVTKEQYTLTFEMGHKNETPLVSFDGFSPIVAPLITFAAQARAKTKAKSKAGVYDFFEETDLRVLKLWAEHGVITDASRPAYVFGDMLEIRKLLYLEGGEPADATINTVFGLDLLDDRGGQVTRQGTPSGQNKSGVGYGTIYEGGLFGNTKEAKKRYAAYKDAFLSKFKKDLGVLNFRHNIEDPNVISLNYSIDNYIAALYAMPVTPRLDKNDLGGSRIAITREACEQSVAKPILDELAKMESKPDYDSFAADLLESTPKSLDLLEAFANSENDLKKSSIDLFAALFVWKGYHTLSEKLRSTQTTANERKFDGDEMLDQYYQAMIDQTSKLLVRCNIRTIPQFQAKGFLLRDCTLEGRTGGIIGFPQKLRKAAPYNGKYQIIEYKHIITPNEAYSEFTLQRKGAANTHIRTGKDVKTLILAALNEILRKNAVNPEDRPKKTTLPGSFEAVPDEFSGFPTDTRKRFDLDARVTKIIEELGS